MADPDRSVTIKNGSSRARRFFSMLGIESAHDERERDN